MLSHQVYVRVIPYKSESTLWVLALGAVPTIGFEGLFIFARSSLMNMTGKRIEMTVQARLMQAMPGMKAPLGGRSPVQRHARVRICPQVLYGNADRSTGHNKGAKRDRAGIERVGKIDAFAAAGESI